MSFVKDMFREFGFAFCISELFPMFFKSCVEISVGSSYRKINTLEEIEILKAASSKHLLNDVIAGQNEPIYKLLLTSVN